MFRILLIAATLFISVNSLSGQQLGDGPVQVLFIGTVYDQYTNERLGVTLTFIDDKEKKWKIKSNSRSGRFEQPLTSGKIYTVLISGWNIVRKRVKINIKTVKKYTENFKDFKVKRLTPSLRFDSMNVFKPKETELSGSSQMYLDYIQEVMKFNRAVKFEFIISGHDTYSDSVDFSEAELKELVDKRTETIKTLVSSWKRYSRRIDISSDYRKCPEEKMENGKPMNYDVMVIVKEIKNPVN